MMPAEPEALSSAPGWSGTGARARTEVAVAEVVEVAAHDDDLVLQGAAAGQEPDDVLGHDLRDVDRRGHMHGRVRQLQDRALLVSEGAELAHRAVLAVSELDELVGCLGRDDRDRHLGQTVARDAEALHPFVLRAGRVDDDDPRGLPLHDVGELLLEAGRTGPAAIGPLRAAVVLHRFEAEEDRDRAAEVGVLGEGRVLAVGVVDAVADEDKRARDVAGGAEAGEGPVPVEFEVEFER
jgi:hypothetical protein